MGSPYEARRGASRWALAVRSVAFFTVAVAVSGCAQGPALIPAEPPAPAVRPETHFYGYDLVYETQPAGNDLVVYKRKKNGFRLTLLQTVSTGLSSPMGIVATSGGRLYVANSGASDVLVYRSTRQGPQGPIATLDDAGEVPTGVAVAPSRRLVAVSNVSTTGGGPGSVSVYLKQRDEPSRTLTYGSDPIQGAGVAVDSNGNCFWSFNDPKTLTGSIVEFSGCKGSGTLFQTGILKAGGLAFDAGGSLYYVDQVAGIYKCDGPSSCRIFVPLGGILGLILPTNINFDGGNPQTLWVADAAGYVDALNLQGLIVYILQTVGGILDPPVGIAPAPGS